MNNEYSPPALKRSRNMNYISSGLNRITIIFAHPKNVKLLSSSSTSSSSSR